MNIFNKIWYGKKKLRHFGWIVVEMSNNNHWKTERATPHNNSVASLLQPRKHYSNDSNLQYSTYKKPTPKIFLFIVIINY